jgi:D-3-phosphoglycerate dehydrogenase
MKLVLIPTKLESVARDILTQKGFRVVQDADTPLAEQIKQHADAEALIVRSEKVTAAVLDALPKLKLVIRAGAGYDNIDTKHARKRGVDVMNTPGANANGVAEEVLAMVLAHYRHVVAADTSTRQGKWEKKNYMGREIAQKTVGIVGLGNIGRLVARRLAGFECTLLGFDPVIAPPRAEEIGVRLVPLEKLFAEADIVTLHVPATAETKGMVNADLLKLMKPGAVLVNCARAEIVNEADLRAAKKEKKLAFLNDVYPEDAAGEKSCADIADLMLPHLGASTLEANWNAARRSAEQLIAYAERGVTTCVVNKGVPEGLDERYQQLAYCIAFVARGFLGLDRPVRRIECSFYGDLQQYAKWFMAPIAAAISRDIAASEDPQDAESFLAGKGIALEVRPTDDSKKFGSSMTIDLLAGSETLKPVSVRGTIAEGNIMISRINDFDRLYFAPQGHSLLVVYRDRPGVLAKITGACADANINIEDIRSPHDTKTATLSLAVLKTNKPVPAVTVDRIRRETESENVVALSLE